MARKLFTFGVVLTLSGVLSAAISLYWGRRTHRAVQWYVDGKIKNGQ